MSHLPVNGLVVRAVEYKEGDLILTVLTESEGKLTVAARGARRRNAPHAAASQVLCYSRMILGEYRERYTLKDAEIIDSFHPLRQDLPAMALACYLADLAQTVAPEGDALHLTLAALNTLAKGKRPHPLVKAAFELRALCGAGVDPTLDPSLPPPEGDLALAARYVRAAPAEKIFSFTMSEKAMSGFAALCERYVLAQLGHIPPSLGYYHSVLPKGGGE